MDLKDLTILEMLKENAKMPLSRIAERIGISETAVKKRIDKLKKEGILLGFTAKINERKLGLVRVFLLLSCNSPKDVAECFSQLRFFANAYLISGKYNLLVELLLPEGFLKNVEELTCLEGVKEKCVLIVMREAF